MSNKKAIIRYTCQLCNVRFKKLGDVKSHIVRKHGNLPCLTCGIDIHLRDIRKHETAHFKQMLDEGAPRRLDLTCNFCGIQRDENGYHFCEIVYQLKNSYTSTKIQRDNKKHAKPTYTATTVVQIDNPYTANISKRYNLVTKSGEAMKIEHKEKNKKDLITKDAYKYYTDTMINKQITRNQKSRNNIFNPKLSARYDIDSDDESDCEY